MNLIPTQNTLYELLHVVNSDFKTVLKRRIMEFKPAINRD